MIWFVNKMKRFFHSRKTIEFGSKGANVVYMDSCVFGHPENIILEDNVYIGENTKIYAQGKVVIKSGAILADTVDIRTANHYYDGEDLNYIPFDEKVMIKPVTIDENVWIASHVLILPGVHIGEGAVVAAGSVVTKDIEPYAVAAGNPAHLIKYRDIERYHKLKKEGKVFMREYHSLPRKLISTQDN